MRVRLAVAVLAVSALCWPPTRRLVADLLITTGAHLDHLGEQPAPTPEQRERMHRRFVDELADALVRRRQTEAAGERKPDGRNGKAGDAVI